MARAIRKHPTAAEPIYPATPHWIAKSVHKAVTQSHDLLGVMLEDKPPLLKNRRFKGSHAIA